MTDSKNKRIDRLYQTVAALPDKKACAELFEDLCTYKEIESMAQRLHAAELLMEGETYESIIEKTGISSATLSRVSKCVKLGKGYKKALTEK